MSDENTKKVLLATGIKQLDETFRHRFQSATVVGTVQIREGVVEAVERTQPDAVVIGEVLDGATITIHQLLLQLRGRFPKVQIIYLLRKDENPQEERFAYEFAIYDLFFKKFSPELVEKSIYNGKKFEDVVSRKDILKHYAISDESIPPVDPDSLSNINEKNYTRIQSDKSVTPIYQQIVAFWSALDKEGKTFSIINTALMLASRPDLKILLLDFNIKNPNTHLHFGSLFDGNRNLSAVLEDMEGGVIIDRDNLQEYLITHPVYPNLKILPGRLIRNTPRSPELIFSAFEQIVQAAQKNNFSTILIDTNSGLSDGFTAKILNFAHRTLLHIIEDPGSLHAASLLFDNEDGDFTTSLLDRKKVFAVVNRSFEKSAFNFRTHLEHQIEIPAISIIPDKSYVLDSIYKGEPLLSKAPPSEMYEAFVLISNAVHKEIFKKPSKKLSFLESNKGAKNNKKNPFSFLKK